MGTWTEDRYDTLRKMWDEGKTANQVAAAMGITRNAVLGQVRHLNLSGRGSPIVSREERFDQMVDMIADFDSEIALAAKVVRLDVATASRMWREMCARGRRQYA